MVGTIGSWHQLRGLDVAKSGQGYRASRMKVAARRRIERRRDLALENNWPPGPIRVRNRDSR